jgi:hypothetical protein
LEHTKYEEDLGTVLVNVLNAGELFPILILDIAYIGTTSQFALISLYLEPSSTLIFFNCILLLDSLVIHDVVYGKAGNVNKVSESILAMLKASKSVHQDPILRRKARACIALKIRVGNSGTYIEN